MSTEVRPIRIAVVDDQELFVYGMRMLIDSQPDLQFAGSAGNGREALVLAKREQPDVMLMDLRMPEVNGVEATARITSGPDARPKVIVLTVFRDERAVLAALRNGASAFLTKDAPPDEVLQTIRTVHADAALPTPAQTFSLIGRFAERSTKSQQPDALLSRLTPRESEVALLIARGLSNAEIARTAHISEATTKTHVRSIMTKLELRSRAHIIVYAYENGLIHPR
jgi:DNA-binding NarL/FixJ family response regulator